MEQVEVEQKIKEILNLIDGFNISDVKCILRRALDKASISCYLDNSKINYYLLAPEPENKTQEII